MRSALQLLWLSLQAGGVGASELLRGDRQGSGDTEQAAESGDCLRKPDHGRIRSCLAHYLRSNMPPWDAVNAGTLEPGILNVTVELALQARQSHAWAADVPWTVFKDWVLPYASTNEARTDWRRLFRTTLAPLVVNATSRKEAVQILNRQLWSALRPWGPIVFKSQQTPLIYDPMSTLAYGFASCTGISIVLVDALRSVGVPARLTGTPAWNGDVDVGNHNWVEVWLGDEIELEEEGWAFMEGAPAGGGSLSDPCTKWFCSPSKMAGTSVFAARFDRQTNKTFYPMSWDLGNRNVPGVNRTAYYRGACARCGSRRLSVHV